MCSTFVSALTVRCCKTTFSMKKADSKNSKRFIWESWKQKKKNNSCAQVVVLFNYNGVHLRRLTAYFFYLIQKCTVFGLLNSNCTFYFNSSTNFTFLFPTLEHLHFVFLVIAQEAKNMFSCFAFYHQLLTAAPATAISTLAVESITH